MPHQNSFYTEDPTLETTNVIEDYLIDSNDPSYRGPSRLAICAEHTLFFYIFFRPDDLNTFFGPVGKATIEVCFVFHTNK